MVYIIIWVAQRKSSTFLVLVFDETEGLMGGIQEDNLMYTKLNLYSLDLVFREKISK